MRFESYVLNTMRVLRRVRARRRLSQAGLRRVIATIVLLTFLPVVSAMAAYEAECLARALSGGSLPAGADPAQHHGKHEAASGPTSHLHEAGPCHMAATPISVLPGGCPAAHVPTDDQWTLESAPRFGSVAWPPPRPRPKAVIS